MSNLPFIPREWILPTFPLDSPQPTVFGAFSFHGFFTPRPLLKKSLQLPQRLAPLTPSGLRNCTRATSLECLWVGMIRPLTPSMMLSVSVLCLWFCGASQAPSFSSLLKLMSHQGNCSQGGLSFSDLLPNLHSIYMWLSVTREVTSDYILIGKSKSSSSYSSSLQRGTHLSCFPGLDGGCFDFLRGAGVGELRWGLVRSFLPKAQGPRLSPSNT